MSFAIVAPHAGAWIETEDDGGIKTAVFVAPHAGAWIETKNDMTVTTFLTGRPSRRGVD